MDIPIDLLIRVGQAETTEAVRAHTARKLSFVLRRFHNHVRYITVRLVDVNGPRRGVDSRCSITAELVAGPQLFVDATAATPFAAITHATSRLGEAIRRMHKRHTGRRVDATTTLPDTRASTLASRDAPSAGVAESE